jgi:phosphoribosylanthranilate isomerase
VEARAGVRVKICGVTNVDDAAACVEAGADAIGVNLVPESPRCVDLATARAITQAVGKGAIVVAVVRNLSLDAMREIRTEARCECLQLHGDEPPEILAPLLPHAYKAVSVESRTDVIGTERYGGEYLLVDAKVAGKTGGTGIPFDWSLVVELARARKLILAGGLTPDNVAMAVRTVRPHTVDVASGVEGRQDPRRKDLGRVRAFVQSARDA